MLDFTNALGHLVLALLMFILGPIALIWALNTLFPSLNIDYSLETWIAIVIVKGAIQSKISFELQRSAK